MDALLTTHAASTYTPPGNASLANLPDVIYLGLTFSFPVEQTALGSGKILTWTKGFAAKNAIGHDVVKLLQDAFDRKHMRVKCVALVNDVCALSGAVNTNKPTSSRLLERYFPEPTLQAAVAWVPSLELEPTAPTWNMLVRGGIHVHNILFLI